MPRDADQRSPVPVDLADVRVALRGVSLSVRPRPVAQREREFRVRTAPGGHGKHSPSVLHHHSVPAGLTPGAICFAAVVVRLCEKASKRDKAPTRAGDQSAAQLATRTTARSGDGIGVALPSLRGMAVSVQVAVERKRMKPRERLFADACDRTLSALSPLPTHPWTPAASPKRSLKQARTPADSYPCSAAAVRRNASPIRLETPQASLVRAPHPRTTIVR